METQSDIELVTKSDLLGLELASWDRPRSKDDLLGFIERREAAIFATDNDN